MFLKISEISYDGKHWYKAEESDQLVLEADCIFPMKGVKINEDEGKEVVVRR